MCGLEKFYFFKFFQNLLSLNCVGFAFHFAEISEKKLKFEVFTRLQRPSILLVSQKTVFTHFTPFGICLFSQARKY